MIRGKRQSILIILILLVSLPAWADDTVENKIKNGKLLAEKALTSSGDQRADYAYKAKREFERAALLEPEDPWPYYWQAVITSYIEGDSAAADRLYAKALALKKKKIAEAPAPWTYQSDTDLKSAFKGEFGWSKAAKETAKPLVEEKKPEPEAKADPLEFFSAAISARDFARAESLYADLIKRPEYADKNELLYKGVLLKLTQDSLSQASALLGDIESKKGRRSPAFRKASELYDAALESTLVEAKGLERGGDPAGAEALLSSWEPYQARPMTAARGKLLLQFGSALLSQKRFSSADSTVASYEKFGYDKNESYRSLKSRLEQAKLVYIPQETKPEIVEIKPEKKVAAANNFVTISPPGGDIVKVVINTIDPATGRVESSDLWETASPTRLKTGSAYKLVVQKKQERKTPKYIALAGILATFLIVR